MWSLGLGFLPPATTELKVHLQMSGGQLVQILKVSPAEGTWP